jgi:tRNA (Thr-GGU) A37 N-methylase
MATIDDRIELRPIGRVSSPLTDPGAAPRQGDEGAPEASLVFEPEVAEGLRSLVPGDTVLVPTWLDRADRDVLSVHPRGDLSNRIDGTPVLDVKPVLGGVEER